jgi:hypothetical protein
MSRMPSSLRITSVTVPMPCCWLLTRCVLFVVGRIVHHRHRHHQRRHRHRSIA